MLLRLCPVRAVQDRRKFDTQTDRVGSAVQDASVAGKLFSVTTLTNPLLLSPSVMIELNQKIDYNSLRLNRKASRLKWAVSARYVHLSAIRSSGRLGI